MFSLCGPNEIRQLPSSELEPLSAFSSSGISTSLNVDTSDGSLLESSQDSVAKRRRHAVYFHRPPVWWSSSQPNENSLVTAGTCSKCLFNMSCSRGRCDHNTSDIFDEEMDSYSWTIDKEQLLYKELRASSSDPMTSIDTWTSDSDQETPLLEDWKPDGERGWYELSPSELQIRLQCGEILNRPWTTIPPLQISHRQVKPGLCTSLKAYRDVRLQPEERWALQEGSLVICIDPSYTLIDHKDRRPDEFELVSGDVYIICRLYADLWALCAKASFKAPPKICDFEATTTTPMSFGFLPLCAVTLAPNFSGFSRRCSEFTNDYLTEVKYPGNGLPVCPPPRSHSLNAGKQIFQGYRAKLPLPAIAAATFNNLPLEGDADFIPLDSNLEQILSKLDGRRCRLHGLRDRMSFPNIWSCIKTSRFCQHQDKSETFFTCLYSKLEVSSIPRWLSTIFPQANDSHSS